jgi:Glycosyltransferase family 87
MMHRLAPRWETVLLTLAAPVTLICLTHGHNGFLTASLLGGGLALLDRRPFIAGLLFGCLIYKPQFALILPVLLLAGGHWRAIAGALASSAILVAATMAIWGWPVWQAFLVALPDAQHIVVEQGGAGWYKLMSAYAAARIWGGSIAAAYALQTVATATSAAGVAWLAWSRKAPELRNALVCAAALISTPYVFDYDFTVLLPGIAFLVLEAERNTWLRWEKSLLAFVWFGPLVAREVAQFTDFPLGFVIASTVAGMALRRASRHRHSAVDVQRLSGDVACLPAGEVHGGRADILA